MAYSGAIADTLREVFSAAGILATFEDKNDVGIFTLRMKLRCRMQSAQMAVLVREENYSTITTLPLTADTDHRLAMAEYLTRVNWNMRNGNFELNMDDGEIRYKTYVHVGQEKPDMAAARLATMLPFLMIDHYGDGIIDVLFGFKTPKEAFESITA
ncbi:MAG: YbjN domain-containing protein [Clostridia bacterium]|nr:YbjN domain-containing protein [Clostridia bacterium]